MSAVMITSFLGLTGCVVHKCPSVYDGSKSDATIAMYYEYGEYEKPVVHWEEAKAKALEKCKNWGYSNVEYFGSGVTECIAYDLEGICERWRVTLKCQCID